MSRDIRQRADILEKDFEEPISENADKVSKNAEKEPVRVMVDIRMTNGMQIRQRD